MPNSSITFDCPRCDTKRVTFKPKDFHSADIYEDDEECISQDYSYASYEVFAVCQACKKTVTLMIVEKYDDENDCVIHCPPPDELDGLLNNHFTIAGFVRLPDDKPPPPPKFLPKNIEKIFNEGAICISKECWNAAGAMFRQCVDSATKDKLPEKSENGLTKNSCGKLRYRIKWLFDNNKLSERLKELANCIREDGNDGAHDGTLTKNDANELLDFTVMLLEDIYTTPTRIKQSEERKKQRRAKQPES